VKRDFSNILNHWKEQKARLPLILEGARQVGKTYLLKSWGREKFKNVHYFNFDRDGQLKEIFANTKSPQRIIKNLEILFKIKISLADDLIFFDEIQTSNEALNSLKYFAEEFPNSYIVTAGSLLGLPQAVKRPQL